MVTLASGDGWTGEVAEIFLWRMGVGVTGIGVGSGAGVETGTGSGADEDEAVVAGGLAWAVDDEADGADECEEDDAASLAGFCFLGVRGGGETDDCRGRFEEDVEADPALCCLADLCGGASKYSSSILAALRMM